MFNLFWAEWQKIVGNRWVAGFTLWIFPVGALAFIVTMNILALFFEPFRQNLMQTLPRWDTAMLGGWAFPSNLLGRMFLMGLTAVTFAGEYQWGTWKNIMPHRQRVALLLFKFITLGILVIFAFGLMTLIFGLGQGILVVVADIELTPALTGEVVREFIQNYLSQASLALTGLLVTAIYAALAGVWMRSILGTVMVGLGLSVAETASPAAFFALSLLFDNPRVWHLYRLLPVYNINNINTWMRQGEPEQTLQFVFGSAGLTAPVDTAATSWLVLLIWVVVGLALILFLFQRQDISS